MFQWNFHAMLMESHIRIGETSIHVQNPSTFCLTPRTLSTPHTIPYSITIYFSPSSAIFANSSSTFWIFAISSAIFSLSASGDSDFLSFVSFVSSSVETWEVRTASTGGTSVSFSEPWFSAAGGSFWCFSKEVWISPDSCPGIISGMACSLSFSSESKVVECYSNSSSTLRKYAIWRIFPCALCFKRQQNFQPFS